MKHPQMICQRSKLLDSIHNQAVGQITSYQRLCSCSFSRMCRRVVVPLDDYPTGAELLSAAIFQATDLLTLFLMTLSRLCRSPSLGFGPCSI